MRTKKSENDIDKNTKLSPILKKKPFVDNAFGTAENYETSNYILIYIYKKNIILNLNIKASENIRNGYESFYLMMN